MNRRIPIVPLSVLLLLSFAVDPAAGEKPTPIVRPAPAADDTPGLTAREIDKRAGSGPARESAVIEPPSLNVDDLGAAQNGNGPGKLPCAEFDLDPAVIAEWLTNPESNHGLIVRGEGVTSVETWFASREHPAQPIQPRLIVGYETP